MDALGAEEALQFLSRAGVRLASSLDVGGTLKNVTELAVPFLGDLCAISWCTSEGGREDRLVACCDPEQKAIAIRSAIVIPLTAGDEGSARSSDGEGRACFTVTLPFAKGPLAGVEAGALRGGRQPLVAGPCAARRWLGGPSG